QEMFDDQELIKAFSLQGISKANAVFNPEKLAWFNAQYIAKLPHEKLAPYLKPGYVKAGLWRDSLEKEENAWFRSLVDLYRPRAIKKMARSHLWKAWAGWFLKGKISLGTTPSAPIRIGIIFLMAQPPLLT